MELKTVIIAKIPIEIVMSDSNSSIAKKLSVHFEKAGYESVLCVGTHSKEFIFEVLTFSDTEIGKISEVVELVNQESELKEKNYKAIIQRLQKQIKINGK